MKKQSWRKVLSIVLCVAMMLSMNAQVFAVGIDITDNGTYLDEKQSDVKSDAQVEAVEKLIDAIDTVEYNDDSLAKIVAAEKAYNKLTAAQKDQVENWGTLKAARNAYDALAADHTDTSALTVKDYGTIGNVKWAVYTNGLFEVSGEGAIPSYSQGGAPWYSYASSITSILVRSSVTGIGNNAFYGCNNITNITLPFVGESRTQQTSLAEGYRNHFGYIFGYTKSNGYKSGSYFTNSFCPNSYHYSYYYSYDSSAGSTSYYYWKYNIPTSLKTVTITDANAIGTAAFNNCENITKIVLNDGITSVGDYAFRNSGIKDFAIPNSVSSIGKYSFYGCTGLTEMPVPNGVTTIPEYAFYGCSNIVKLTLSRNVKSIGNYAFYNCSKVNKLVIPDKTETIGSYVFYGCSSIPEINIPDSVTSIGTYAFSGDAKATKLNVGSRLKTIPSYAFQNCTGLTSVTIPNTITKIESFAFYGCNNVTSITLPFVGESRTQQTSLAEGYRNHFGYIFGYTKSNGYKSGSYSTNSFCPNSYHYSYYYSYNSSTGNTSYYYWEYKIPTSLKTVTITDANAIGTAAFNNCENITKIVLNDGITSVGDYAFQNNPWYTGLTDEFVIDGDNVLIKYNGTKSGVTIPETVKSIAGGVFKGKTAISSVTLPDDLEIIGENAFDGCTNLTVLTIPKSVVTIGTNAIPSTCKINVYRPSAGYNYRSTNRIVLNNSYTTGNETYYYIVNDDGCAEIIGCTTTSTELTVPTDIDGIVVNKIGDYGFANCTTLNSITIPANIRNIGKHSFDSCTGLINATIPTTVDSVGDYAFNNCTGLKNVTISEGVKSIGKGCFCNCTSLIEAVVPDTCETLGSYAFYNCTAMTTATIGITAADVKEYTFCNCNKLNTVVIGINVTEIGDYAFYGCALERVSIPASTTSLGKYCFAENKKMVKATLRKNLLSVGDDAFKNCILLATVTIPSTVVYVGAEAFENCSSLASVTLPVGVTVINNRTFSNCKMLSTVVMEGNVTKIGVSAFYNNAFSAINLPESVTTIDISAFRDCKRLNEIFIPKNMKKIGDAAFFGCTALSFASLPDSPESTGSSVLSLLYNLSIGESAFYFNNDLTIYVRNNRGQISSSFLQRQGMSHIVLDPAISSIGSSAFASCLLLEDITYGDETVNYGEYKFSAALKTIGSEAFKDNPLLRNFIVSDTIESIGTNAFYNVVQSGYHCKDITVTFYYVNGVVTANILDSQYVRYIILNDNIHTLSDKAFYNCPVLETISIPDTVSSVGINVFANPGKNVTAVFRGVDGTIDASVYNGKTTGLKYIAVDENVDTIGDYAFANTDTVVGVVITDTDTIGKYAFYQGKVLNYVEISACDTIDDYAFSENLVLKRVEVDYVKNINDYAFFDDIAINDLYIDADLYHIGEHAFDSCKSIPKVVLPETVREIGAYAFYDCNSMQSINIPYGVKCINDYTFFGCALLLDVDLPNTVKSVGDYAYYGCVLINKLDIGTSVETIGDYAFYNCNKVKTLNIPNSVKTVGDYAFRSCSSIVNLYIPNSVTDIGNCTFYACTNLEKVEFGRGITQIDDRVFYACVKLKFLYLYGTVTDLDDYAFYGAEDVTIYSRANDYVETYCDDNALGFELLTDHTKQYDLNSDDVVDGADYSLCVNIALGARDGISSKVIDWADYDEDGAWDVLDCVLIEREMNKKTIC